MRAYNNRHSPVTGDVFRILYCRIAPGETRVDRISDASSILTPATIKEVTFVYQDKGDFFMLFGRKSGKNGHFRASKRSIGCFEARFFRFRGWKRSKCVVYFLHFFAMQRNNKSVLGAGFEPRKSPYDGGFRETEDLRCFFAHIPLRRGDLNMHEKKLRRTAWLSIISNIGECKMYNAKTAESPQDVVFRFLTLTVRNDIIVSLHNLICYNAKVFCSINLYGKSAGSYVRFDPREIIGEMNTC